MWRWLPCLALVIAFTFPVRDGVARTAPMGLAADMVSKVMCCCDSQAAMGACHDCDTRPMSRACCLYLSTTLFVSPIHDFIPSLHVESRLDLHSVFAEGLATIPLLPPPKA